MINNAETVNWKKLWSKDRKSVTHSVIVRKMPRVVSEALRERCGRKICWNGEASRGCRVSIRTFEEHTG
jgi:hypothetical protein